jgi:hypothetical protein
MYSHGFSFPLVSLSSTMWNHTLLSKIGQIPQVNVAQPWWHEDGPPFLQARIYNLLISDPVKIPRFSTFESHTFQ